jgi:hypothetical protein
MPQSLGCLLLHNSELHEYFSINFQVFIRNNQRELNVLIRRLPFLRKIFFPPSQLCSVLAVKKGIRCQTHCRKHCFMNEVPFTNQKRTPNLTVRILILILITYMISMQLQLSSGQCPVHSTRNKALYHWFSIKLL